MKCQIRTIKQSKFMIRKFDKCNARGHWCSIDIPEEIYEEIKNKFDNKPYTGIHGEIFRMNRRLWIPEEVVFDYLYCNGFDYMFEE